MSAIKYRVTLTDEEVDTLKVLLHKGKNAACQQTRVRILLKAAAVFTLIFTQPKIEVSGHEKAAVKRLIQIENIGGRTWDRTTDPCRVKAVLSR